MASIAVGILLVQLYRQSTQAQVANAQAVVDRACDLVRDRYGFYTAGWSGQSTALPDDRLRSDLTAVLAVALGRQDRVEGGIWQADAGSLAYAYPTYEGTGPKTDLPVAELDQIQAVNQRAAHDNQPADLRVASRTQTLLLHACPLAGPVSSLTAWTMTRVQATQGLRPLQLGLGVLFALMVLMSVWLGRVLLVWGRHVRGIEFALASAGNASAGNASAGNASAGNANAGQASAGHAGMPAVPRTGERELDRIIDALNDAGQRLAKARQDAEQMAVRVARAEHLAGLGRVAAGVAHEIRNPIAAARLQGENALAGDDARRRQAISDILGQIDRLDALAGELLAMTQRVDPRPVRVDLRAFLDKQVARHKGSICAKRLTLHVRADDGSVVLDPAIIGRILDNLLINAIRHAPEGGSVALAAERSRDLLTLTVEDNGTGVSPNLADRLFEPFVTGRADGTGLGLAIARELADAHDGRLLLRPPVEGRGAVFALELPQADQREDVWPRS